MVLTIFQSHFHEGLILGTRTAYPLPFGLMTAMWGCLSYRREIDLHLKRGVMPWVLNLFCSFFVYAFGGGIVVDLVLFGKSPALLRDDRVLACFVMAWIIVNVIPKVGDYLMKFPVFLCVEACMILDASTGSMNMLETISLQTETQVAMFFWFTILWTFMPPIWQWWTRVHLYGNSKAELKVPPVCYIIFTQQVLYYVTMIVPCMNDSNKSRCHESNMIIYTAGAYATWVAYICLAIKMYRDSVKPAVKKGRTSNGPTPIPTPRQTRAQARALSLEKKKK